jgi:GH24 family phage-related lysozyme (muramidase)
MSVKRYALTSTTIIALLGAGGAVLESTEQHEGYAPVATVPVKGDPCTGGFGSTTYLDGSKVKCGDVFTPEYAEKRTSAYLLTQNTQLNACITANLTPVEYGMIADHAYQYGVDATCKSAIVRYANKGEYMKSCVSHLNWKYVRGYDCSTSGNKVCAGVWTRSVFRYNSCMNEQRVN